MKTPKQLINPIYDYPYNHISSYASVTDVQLKAIEHYLAVLRNIDLKPIKQSIKEKIYLTKDTTADGRSFICINYPSGFEHMTFLCDDKSIDQIIKDTKIFRYHSCVQSEDKTIYSVDIASVVLDTLPNGKEQISQLAYKRKMLYTQHIVGLYNELIDAIDKNEVIESIPIDKLNNLDF